MPPAERPPAEGVRSRRLVAIIAGLAALALGGCGGSSSDEAAGLSKRSIVDLNDLPAQLIDARDRAKYKPGSAERAFLDYWSSLQYQDWTGAAASFDAAVKAQVGVPRAVEALRSQAGLFRQTRPTLVDTATVDGLTSVRYAIRDLDGALLTETVAWRRSGGEWRLVYDSFLDDALRATAQAAAQNRINPDASRPSPRALEARDAAGLLLPRALERVGP